MHKSLALPRGAGFLGFAAVLPEHRGSGAGRVLGETVLAWARDAGYPAVVTDWRMTNVLAFARVAGARVPADVLPPPSGNRLTAGA